MKLSVRFEDVRLGDELAFETPTVTATNTRMGAVVSVSERAVTVICPDGKRAVLRRADWANRHPRR